MIFYKTVSSGNDFIHVNVDEPGIASPAGIPSPNDRDTKSDLARRICERQTGAGADGIVYYRISGETVYFEIYNRDGGEAELSGNGMAGVTALLFYLEKRHDVVTLNTKAGVKTNRYLSHEKNIYRLKIDIGEPNFQDSNLFPFLEKGKIKYNHRGIEFYPVSVGNPHAVVILETFPTGDKLEEIGKCLGNADIFPFKANVEIVVPKQDFPIYFYERGVGPTLASSTGSAAVYSVLNKLKLTDGCLTIPGVTSGEDIKVSGDQRVYIENSTKIIYKGEYLSEYKKT
jgi:diaminopimelate epimerase